MNGRTTITIAKIKKKMEQTVIYKSLQRKLKIEQHEPMAVARILRLMGEVRQILKKEKILFVFKGYTCIYKSEAFASIALRPWHNKVIKAMK
jgi:DNA polymerase elongation subunit (family B)